MIEIWKDIHEFEGRYQVSNLGNVKSLNYNKTGEERILKPYDNGKGYLLVNLFKGKRTVQKLVHRLVAEAFIPNQNALSQINHKDENRQNNAVYNLEWCDVLYNLVYSRGDAVYCVELDKVFDYAGTAGRELGICDNSIRKCCRGERNTAGGYHWRFATA